MSPNARGTSGNRGLLSASSASSRVHLWTLCALTAALSSCSFAPSSRSGTVTDRGPGALHVPPVADRHEYARPAAAKPGQWARYRIVRGASAHELTLGLVARGTDGTWVEVVEEGLPRRASLRLVADDGRVLRALFREVPGEPAEQSIVQGAPHSAPEFEGAPEEGEEPVAGQRLRVRVWRIVRRDDELGRELREECAFSASVPPLYLEQAGAGLVRLVKPGLTAQLVAWGEGYPPVISISER